MKTTTPVLILLALVACDLQDDTEFCAAYADLECTERLDRLLADTGEIGLMKAQLEGLPTAAELAELDSTLASLSDRVDTLEAALGIEDTGDVAMDVGALADRVATLEDYLEQDTGFGESTLSDDYLTAEALESTLEEYVDYDSLLALGYAGNEELDLLSARLDTGLAMLDDHEDRISVIEADYATSTGLSAVETQVTTIEGDYLTSSDYEALEDSMFFSGTLTVGGSSSTYSKLEDALTDLALVRIAPGETVVISLEGKITLDDEVDLGHPDGARVFLDGNGYTVETAASDAGLFLGSFDRFGGIYDLTVDCAADVGLLLSQGAELGLANVTVENCITTGVQVEDRATLYVDPLISGSASMSNGLTVTSAGEDGIKLVNGDVVANADVTTDGDTRGLRATDHSTLVMEPDAATLTVAGGSRAMSITNFSEVRTMLLTFGGTNVGGVYVQYFSGLYVGDTADLTTQTSSASYGVIATINSSVYIDDVTFDNHFDSSIGETAARAIHGSFLHFNNAANNTEDIYYVSEYGSYVADWYGDPEGNVDAATDRTRDGVDVLWQYN